MRNSSQSKARRLAVFAIILDIVTFSVGFGFIFVAIGHDANSALECAPPVNTFCLSKSVADTLYCKLVLTTACDTQTWQAGTDTETLLAGQSSAVFTVTYSAAAFSSIPNVTITPTSSPVVSGTLVTFTSHYFFIAQEPGVTWTSMPSVVTELFGLTDHRLNITRNIPQQTVRLGVDCTIASNTAGAKLQLQDSVNGGTTWSNVVVAQVVVDNTKCPGTLISNYGSLVGTAPASGTFLLRVVGSGGGGAGDNPVFTNIYVDGKSSFANVNTCLPFLQPASFTTTAFQYTIQCNLAVVADTTFTYSWTAFICKVAQPC